MHIQKRARPGRRDPVYVARYTDPTGRERSKSFTRKVDAENYLSTQRKRELAGEWTDPDLGRTQLADWIERWLPTVTPGLKPKTVESYLSLLRSRILPALGSHPLSSLRPSDVQTWIAAMVNDGLSPSRIRQAKIVLSLALEAAVADGLLARNPAAKARQPRLDRREALALEPADVEAIAAAAVAPYDLLFRILGRLGLRFGEAAALRRRSVDPIKRRLLVRESLAEVRGELIFDTTKSHASRGVPVPPATWDALEEHLESQVARRPDALLFTSPGGGPLRYDNVYHAVWRPALDAAGLPRVGLHVLRHSAAAGMISAGWSAKAVQSVLGHRSAAFTLTVYGHLFDSDMDELAERLDELPRERKVHAVGKTG